MLGKRKRKSSLDKRANEETNKQAQQDYHALLRRHFESTYGPLHVDVVDAGAIEPEDTDDSEEWAGISDRDGDEDGDDALGEHQVEVIDHSTLGLAEEDADLRIARKAFMTSKLPSEVTLQALQRSTPSTKEQDSSSEAALVKNDLALQRLLRESKLISSSRSGPDTALKLAGKSRHKALDAHLQNLGAKTSLHTQKSMPRNQRMGIAKKAVEKEATRRAEAKEAGVVLEKVQKAPSVVKRRERGVGAPGVGKFRGGTLKLSAKDVRSIQGAPSRMKGKKGKKR